MAVNMVPNRAGVSNPLVLTGTKITRSPPGPTNGFPGHTSVASGLVATSVPSASTVISKSENTWGATPTS
jgi:hypothetical protein